MYMRLILHHVANCGVPEPPENGTIVNYTSAVEESAVLYQCNPGFGPVGEMTAVCAANGSWSPNPADVTCHEIGMHAGSKIFQVVLNKALAIVALSWLPQVGGLVLTCHQVVLQCQWGL